MENAPFRFFVFLLTSQQLLNYSLMTEAAMRDQQEPLGTPPPVQDLFMIPPGVY